MRIVASLLQLILLLGGFAAAAQDKVLQEILQLPWQTASGKIGKVAQINLPAAVRFLDAAGTSRFLELNGNPPRPDNYTVAPESLEWFAVFSFDATGYVKDDEALDKDQLLKALKEQNEAGGAERRKLGLPVLTLDGWAVPPHYDSETRRLEWGTRLLDQDGRQIVNYSIRMLGRSGVMQAVLVSDPRQLDEDIREFKASLRGYDFVAGERYAEYRQGDKLADYGLAALIVGGAAAAAAKAGLFKTFGKFIGIAAVGGLAVAGAFFKRLFGRKA
jgi:uncharacterized membrane-anchored protein